MKKKTKVIIAIVGTAALGGAILYMRSKQSSKTVVDLVSSGSIAMPSYTPVKSASQPIPVVVENFVKPAPVIATTTPAPKHLEPSPITYSQPFLTKQNYLMQRDISLAGLLL